MSKRMRVDDSRGLGVTSVSRRPEQTPTSRVGGEGRSVGVAGLSPLTCRSRGPQCQRPQLSCSSCGIGPREAGAWRARDGGGGLGMSPVCGLPERVGGRRPRTGTE